MNFFEKMKGLPVLLVFAGAVACGADVEYLPEIPEEATDYTPATEPPPEVIVDKIPDDTPPPVVFPEELTLEYVLQITNQRRQIIHAPDMARIGGWINGREPVVFDGAALFNDRPAANLSAEEAAYDINTLFRLLRHIYAGYHYFGGDGVFLPLKAQMLDEVRQRESWTDTGFSELIQRGLGTVIADYHFALYYGSSTFGNPHNGFFWDTPFDRSERGFRKRETGLYVIYAEGHDCGLFRLAVNEAGEFFYVPVIFTPGQGELYIVFENGERVAADLTRTPRERTHPRGAAGSLRFVDGVPVICIRRMGNSFNPYAVNHQEALRLMGYAERLRDEPVIIVDIRANEGGASAFTYKWLYILLGEVVPANFNWLGFFDSEIYVADGVSRPARWYRGFTRPAGFEFEYPPELFGKFLHMETIAEGIYFTPEEARDGVIANDKLIIVLVDRFTVSSGEIFTDQFTNIENTLIIGQNTFGMLLTSSGLPLYLPNSGLPVRMGRYMLVHPEGAWQEGVGFVPDVWATGDALAAALAIVSAYRTAPIASGE